MPYILLAAGI